MKKLLLASVYAVIPWATMYAVKLADYWYIAVDQKLYGMFGSKYLFIIALEGLIISSAMFLQSIIEGRLLRKRNLPMSGLLLLLAVLVPVLMTVSWFTKSMITIMWFFGLFLERSVVCQFILLFCAIIRIGRRTISGKEPKDGRF